MLFTACRRGGLMTFFFFFSRVPGAAADIFRSNTTNWNDIPNLNPLPLFFWVQNLCSPVISDVESCVAMPLLNLYKKSLGFALKSLCARFIQVCYKQWSCLSVYLILPANLPSSLYHCPGKILLASRTWLYQLFCELLKCTLLWVKKKKCQRRKPKVLNAIRLWKKCYTADL